MSTSPPTSPTHATGEGLLSLHSIIIPERLREDTPSIRSKIEADIVPSILEHGLIHPITLNVHSELRTGQNIYRELIDSHFSLIAGWSRLTAFSLLQFSEIPYNSRTDLPDHEHFALELEENIRRNDMTWQDRAKAIAKVHSLKVLALGATAKWGLRQTGELIGQSLGHVQEAIKFARCLTSGDEEIINADSPTEARKILLQRKEDEIHKALLRAQSKQKKQTEQLTAALTPDGPQLSTTALKPQIKFVADGSNFEQTNREYVNVDLSRFINGDSVRAVGSADAVMDTFENEEFDLIYTDIPYGIDMSNLTEMVNIERVEDAHGVEENLEQMPLFLKHSFRVLKDKGYLLFWMDIKHWEKLVVWGEDVGFNVQPYPLIWHKTHTCKNKAAHCYWTKNIEYVMVMRKGKATLGTPQQSCVFSCSGYEERNLQSNPFAKPFEFSKWLLEPILLPGMKVLDCYAGEGSGVRALLNLGANVTAIEKSKKHYPRLIEHVKQYYRELHQGYVTFSGIDQSEDSVDDGTDNACSDEEATDFS